MARMKASGRLTVLFVALLFAAMPSRATGAEELNFRKNVGDFWVYLSVMPADFISGPPLPHPARIQVVRGRAPRCFGRFCRRRECRRYVLAA